MSWLKRKIQGGTTGPRNYFGDGSDGDIRVGAAGAERSMDGGVTWAAISTWTLVGTVVSIPSVQDGDMVVVNARSLQVNAGYTLTVANRCRGLLIYCTATMTINGELSMTARGCRANPADAGVTDDTPVAPTDGHAVPDDGIAIRRLAAGSTDTHVDVLMHGCGNAAVEAEANQPEVDGNGVVVNIPRVGGAGGGRVTPSTTGQHIGLNGKSVDNGLGGGGSGGLYTCQPSALTFSGSGAAASCFAGGPGGGGCYTKPVSAAYAATDGTRYGGPGGAGDDYQSGYVRGGDAPGNPNGGEMADEDGGLPGLLLIVVGDDISGTGTVCSNGSDAWAGAGDVAGGGGSGGGIAVMLYAGVNNYTGTISADPGHGGANGKSSAGGSGGAGAAIGPIKIDPR